MGGCGNARGRCRCPADLFYRAPLVSPRDRLDFSDRVRLAVGPDRRTHRLEWNYASPRISPGGPRSTGRPRIVDLADALLAQFERRLPAFFVWRRSSTVAAIDFWNRACAVTRRFGRFLSFAHDRRS